MNGTATIPGEEWRTRERLRTNPEGAVRFRGFHGDYAARAPRDSARKSATFVVARQPAMPLTLVL